MSKQEMLIKILEVHSVEYILCDGLLLAREDYTVRNVGVLRSFTRYQDISEYTVRELYLWLGY
jgi:hypothetical protein